MVVAPTSQAPIVPHQPDAASSWSTPGVCVSLAAFEPADWIDALLNNTFTVNEGLAGVAVHLDAKESYSRADTDRWNGMERVKISPRVSTAKWTGSVLWAHTLNALTIARHFPSCHYVLTAHLAEGTRSHGHLQ
jgi:hypothetical protein